MTLAPQRFVSSDRFRGLALAAVLLALVAAAYAPAAGGGFIWDDDNYVTENMTLTEAGGLRAIWFSPSSTPQHYPMVFTTFWLEHRLWGFNPAGYHVVNVILHGLAALILWRVLALLGLRWAWLAAAVFALHPVQVESAAWIAERIRRLLYGLGMVSAPIFFS